jgi:hypothetical protein
MPERLSIPGFLRGSRWVAMCGQPRYLVLYEVAELGTLTSAAYLERLNNPTAWTSKVMPHYRGMTRGLCSVIGSWGLGMGSLAYLARFKPRAGAEEPLRQWLREEALPPLPATLGLGGAHLLQGAATGEMTNEQRIRGADARVDLALMLTGYEAEALLEVTRTLLGPQHLERRGAAVAADGVYSLCYTLTHAEVDA